jgi:CelD/BcsL family acetyltransferase involved in cellulose biosynthesis
MRGRSLVVSEVQSLEEFARLREEWTGLLTRTRSPSVFQTWEWLGQWWRTFGDDNTLKILCVRDAEGRLQGSWPMYEAAGARSKGGLRRLHFLGTGEAEADEVASEYADILADREREAEVVHALLQYMITMPWDQLVMPKVLEGSCFTDSFLPAMARSTSARVAKIPSGVRYFVELPRTWDAYLERLGSKKRKRIQNYRRRLEREGSYSHRAATEPGQLPAAFATLARLHEVRWASRGKSGAFASPRFIAFHRALIDEFSRLGWLELRIWQYAGRDVAALYGFRWGNTVSYYQSGFDTSATGSISLGLVAVMDTIESAIDSGYERFDFMRGGDNSYKETYECETVNMVDVIVYNATLRGWYHYLNRTARNVARHAMARLKATVAQATGERATAGGTEASV